MYIIKSFSTFKYRLQSSSVKLGVGFGIYLILAMQFASVVCVSVIFHNN